MNKLSYLFLAIIASSMFLATSCQKKTTQVAKVDESSSDSKGISETDISKDLSMLLSVYLPGTDYVVVIKPLKKRDQFYEFKTLTKSTANSGFNPAAKRLCQGIEHDFNQCIVTLLKKEGCVKIYKENDFQYFACGCK
jgi:hypothetical protein